MSETVTQKMIDDMSKANHVRKEGRKNKSSCSSSPVSDSESTSESMAKPKRSSSKDRSEDGVARTLINELDSANEESDKLSVIHE